MKTISKIKDAVKKTEVRVYLNEKPIHLKHAYQYVVIGEWKEIKEFLLQQNIHDYYVETKCVNSALALSDLKEDQVRIEPNATIRENVRLGKNTVVLMGAIINTGCVIGDHTMIDMGAVLGGHVIVKENCHIGANAVIAGVLEPYCEKSVVVEKNCFIGAGAVILEGVHIGESCIVGANAVVREDLPDHCVAVGVPARIIKINETENEFIQQDLRVL